MNRIDRLTAIIIFLQGRPHVAVDKLAERYAISERTVYRDLIALQEAGVPIGSEAGRGYFIVRGYHMPPVMFTKKEVAALLAGERLMQKWKNTELGDSYIAALDKVRSVLTHNDKAYLDSLDQHIRAFPYHDEPDLGSDFKAFTFLQDAIISKAVITIEYYSPYKDQITERNVEPLGLLLRTNKWYLAAWCRLRADYRVFRIERIEYFKRNGERLTDPLKHTLKEFSETNLNQEKNLTEVTVLFSKEMNRYIGDQKYYHGWTSERETDDGIEMDFMASSIEYFARWALTWGNGIKIMSPGKLQKRVKELSQELYEHHGNSD